ncbi:MAG: DUF4157 domain-containing protein, partial [Deltaproteobacteria bacterium]|nr:DUF4157 domain-containing protein [Kofleriaceae bacterium]
MDALPAIVRELGSERARTSSDMADAPPARAPAHAAHGAVQADGGRIADMDPFAVHLAAREGVSGGGTTLPHLAIIQRAFGHHDVTGVRAHVGGAAAAADEIGARAYATGDDVAFASTPDLRQAAQPLQAGHVQAALALHR